MPKAAPKKPAAKPAVRPAVVRKTVEAAEHLSTAGTSASFADGGGLDVDEPVQVEAVTAAAMKKQLLAYEAFMNQPVVILIPQEGREGDLDVVSLWVNGRCQPVQRDVETTVRRCYVECLAHARKATYKQITNPNDWSDTQNVPVISLSYPFTVLSDPAGSEGRAWLKRMLAQPF